MMDKMALMQAMGAGQGGEMGGQPMPVQAPMGTPSPEEVEQAMMVLQRAGLIGGEGGGGQAMPQQGGPMPMMPQG